MSNQTTAWQARRAATRNGPRESAARPEPPVWLTRGVLVSASLVLLALACASAWLSYHAQVAYVFSRNGEHAAQARVWALLLDAGTAGVSLLRLHETLHGRPGFATRVSLLGCIAASVTMNLLHAAFHTPSAYLVAAVPPVMYAVFLEHLLSNLRSLLLPEAKRRTAWRSTALWINFPGLMWSGRRGSLRRIAEERLTAPARDARCADSSPRAVGNQTAEEERDAPVADSPTIRRTERPSRRGRGPGAKRIAFEKALVEQVRGGDLRLFSDDERERNAAAYQAAASLPAPLSRGAARRYVVQALHRIGPAGSTCGAVMPESDPEIEW